MEAMSATGYIQNTSLNMNSVKILLCIVFTHIVFFKIHLKHLPVALWWSHLHMTNLKIAPVPIK